MSDLHDESLWLETLLQGSVVDQCWFGPAIWLILHAPERNFMLTLGTPVQFSAPNGPRQIDPHVDPDDPMAAARLLSLYTRRVESVRILRDGTLDIRFSKELGVTVPRSEEYEAWQVVEQNRSVADGGIVVVCMPGGELAIWR